MIWQIADSRRLILHDDAVRDILSLVNYFRLSCQMARDSMTVACKEADDNRTRENIKHYEYMDKALALIGSNLRQRFDMFRMKVAQDAADDELSKATDRKARKLSKSPLELAYEYAIAASRQGAIDDSGDGDAVGKAGRKAVRGRNHGPSGTASVSTGGKPQRKR